MIFIWGHKNFCNKKHYKQLQNRLLSSKKQSFNTQLKPLGIDISISKYLHLSTLRKP